MSVSAVVYKRLEDVVIPAGADLKYLLVDDSTGEVYFDDASQGRLPRGNVFEVHKRLGNMARIDSLRNEISHSFGRNGGDSLLLNAFLYDGTHGGDMIAVEDRARLKEEVERLRKTSSASDDMAILLSDVEELILASERCGNPIVFL